MNMVQPRALLAEFMGTFALTFIGTMTAAMAGEGFGGVPAGDVVIPALGHGLILAALVYAIGHVSGCHINPAVTISLAAIGKFPLRQVGPYLGAQVSGGLLGALFHFWVRPGGPSDYGLTLPGAGIGDGQAFLLEAVLTFLLVTVIIGVAVSGKAPPAVAGIAIGGTLAASFLQVFGWVHFRRRRAYGSLSKPSPYVGSGRCVRKLHRPLALLARSDNRRSSRRHRGSHHPKPASKIRARLGVSQLPAKGLSLGDNVDADGLAESVE